MPSELVWSGHGCEIRCGDGPSGLLEIDPGSAKAVITDPPYAVLTNTNIAKPKSRSTGHEGNIRRSVGFDALDEDEYVSLITNTMRGAVHAVCDGWAHVFCAERWLWQVALIGQEVGLNYHLPFAFVKTNPPPRIRKKGWKAAMELSAVFSNGSTEFGPTHDAHNWWMGAFEHPGHRIHETQKPTELLKHLIEHYTEPGDLVLDPFGGSCNLVVAAIALDRRCIVWEIDPQRCETARTWFEEGLHRARLEAGGHGVLQPKNTGHPSLFEEAELA